MNDSVVTELLSFEQSRQTTAKFGKPFYFASWFMGKHTAERAYRLYHVCRRLDDIADQADRDNSEALLAIQNYLEQQCSAGNTTSIPLKKRDDVVIFL